MLTVKIPLTYKQEREYIIQVLLGDFLGIDFHIEFQDRQNISIGDKDGKELIISDVLFQTPQNQWLTTNSLPKQPLDIWDTDKIDLNCTLVNPKIPIIYGQPPFDFPKRNFLPIDIFGSAFFMLTRYEEVVKPDKDEHDRFPATSSLAYQENFLERPIINEYLEILWCYLQRLWPSLVRQTRIFRILPTHDVDMPYDILLRSFGRIALNIGSDILYRKNPAFGARNFKRWLKIRADREKDPFDTFNWIMKQSENIGVKSSFYFTAGGSTQFDTPYSVNHPSIQCLIKKLHNRGHELGFHASYEAGFNQKVWNQELVYLNRHINGIKIEGGRQHFLRFQVPKTWRFWNDAKLLYDSTLCFADFSGFRCGICYEYPVFDLIKKEKLSLKERPLIVMDCSVIEDQYMGYGCTEKTLIYMIQLKKHCQIYDGDFVLLWHNHRLADPREKEIYRSIMTLQ